MVRIGRQPAQAMMFVGRRDPNGPGMTGIVNRLLQNCSVDRHRVLPNMWLMFLLRGLGADAYDHHQHDLATITKSREISINANTHQMIKVKSSSRFCIV